EGDLVVGIVRRPDPVPCVSCAAGEWDMCRNGRYTEHGIKARHGFARERWRVPAGFAVPLDPVLDRRGVLLEPASVLAKAWEHVERVGERALWYPETVLVTGAGPIGLLGALLGVQLGLEVHVLDRVESGPKPELVRALGATYHSGRVADVGFAPDVIMECTGVGTVIGESIATVAASGVVCLTGVGHDSAAPSISTASLAAGAVLRNNVVVGSVNANKRHWFKAGEALARADRSWLGRLITRREAPEGFAKALARRPEDIKVVIQFVG
ncbi:MAG TPA: theronine dehydrogenase, partial [Methylomirabilota bacterium]